MWPSSAFKAAALALALASAAPAGSGLWSIAYLNEPYYLSGAFHPTLEGAAKLDIGPRFRAQTRLSISKEAYGLLSPRRDPRAWDLAWGVLGGTRLPFLQGGLLEVSAGVGAILGRTQGELYYNHVWSGGFFPDRTLEYRKVLYADVGVPYQFLWLFKAKPGGFGLEFTGFVSREVRRWGMGVCWQSSLGGSPEPRTASHAITHPARSPGSKTQGAGTEAPKPAAEEPDSDSEGPAPGAVDPKPGAEGFEPGSEILEE